MPVESRDSAASGKDEVVSLSPFEVVSDNKGYYGANTMSGTRFNSKLEDHAASITVMTKEQMADFAMLDINDIFLYTASTEGTGTYTAQTVNRNGDVQEDVSMNPTQANRVRGIAPANISLGNTETMGRTPVVPLAVDAVEISRGPNANVFGLGDPSGTVNMVPSSANLSRERTQVQFRADSYGRLPHEPRSQPRPHPQQAQRAPERFVPARRLPSPPMPACPAISTAPSPAAAAPMFTSARPASSNSARAPRPRARRRAPARARFA